MNKLINVIGLEVHIELSTQTKMFCGCSAKHFGEKPNVNVCPVCMGLPGAMPYANENAIRSCIKLGMAMGCKINKKSKFDRKHYFYPDLPKGYQISQYDAPLCDKGEFQINTNKQSLSLRDKYQYPIPNNSIIRIRRIHMEEDTAKMIHKTVNGKPTSLVDFNRSGVPLVELVTEPDFRNTADVETFLKRLQVIVKYLGISDADMEKGSMRLEANISLYETRNSKNQMQNQRIEILPDYKVELKNINSFRFLRKAIDAEIKRQSKILTDGGKVIQETRGYRESTNETFSQRVKEEANDYRYFPEPDLPTIILDSDMLKIISDNIPEMPDAKLSRYVDGYKIKREYAEILVNNYERSVFFDDARIFAEKFGVSIENLASVMVNQNLDKKFLTPALLVAELVKLKRSSYASVSDVSSAVEDILNANRGAVLDYKKGKVQVIGYLVGSVQKKLSGHGDPKEISNLLIERLSQM